MCREIIRDENIKSTIRKFQIDPTALYVEFQRKLSADENYLIVLQNRSDVLNTTFDKDMTTMDESVEAKAAFLDEPGHKEKYYCGVCLAKYFVKKAQNNSAWYWPNLLIPFALALPLGVSLNCAFYRLDDIFLNSFTRTVPLKWYQKISVYCGLYLAFLWWIVFRLFMVNVKKLQVKGEVLLELINLIPVNWTVLS